MKRRPHNRRRPFSPRFQALEQRCMLVGELVELFVAPRKDGNLLPVDADGDFQAQVGDILHLEVAYSDLRNGPDARGIFQLATDITSSQTGLFTPLLKETQRLEIDQSFRSPGSGSLTLSIAGSSQTSNISQNDFSSAPVTSLTSAVEALGFAAGDIRIRQRAITSTDIFDIIFIGNQFANVDVPNLSVQVTASPSVSASFEEIPALNPDGSPNGNALFNSIDLRSRTFVDLSGTSNAEFFQTPFGTYNHASTAFSGVGGVGPAVAGGVPALSQSGTLPAPFVAFSIPVMVTAPGENVVIDVKPNSGTDSVGLYGSPSTVSSDLVLLGSGSQFRIDFNAASPFATNPGIAEDVNNDGVVSMVDALNALNRLLTGVGTEPFYDVNADGLLTAKDPHQVLNRLFELQGGTLDTSTGDLLAYRLNVVDGDGNNLLDANRHLALNTGQDFFIEIAYDDLRSEVARLGAFSLFADLAVSNPNVLAFDDVPTFSGNITTTSPYTLLGNPTVTSSTTDTVDEVGVIGNVSVNGFDAGTTTRRAMRFRAIAVEPSENVVVELGRPETAEILLYGRSGVVAPNQIVLGDASRFTLSVTPPSVVALDDSFTVQEDSGTSTLLVLQNDSIPEGSTSTLAITVGATLGTATVDNQVIRYTPNANASGVDTFTYQITNVLGSSMTQSTAVVTVTISPINDPPQASAITFTGTEDTVLNIPIAQILAAATDPDPGDTLSLQSIQGLSNGGTFEVDGAFVRFTPTADFFGDTSVFYTISDASGLTSSSLLTVTVQPVNDPPTTTDVNIQVTPNQSLDLPVANLLALSSAGPGESDQTLSVTSVATSTTGASVTLADGVITYQPPTDLRGEDSFTFTVSDGELSVTGTVSIDLSFSVETIDLNLPVATANDVLIRRNGEDLEVIDTTSDSILLKRPKESIEALRIHGSPTMANTFTLEIPAESELRPFGMLSLFGGESSNDAVNVQGQDTLNTRLNVVETRLSSGVFAEFTDTSADGDFVVGSLFFESFESARFQNLLHVAVDADDTLDIGEGELVFSASTPVQMGAVTLIDGGTIRSTSPIALRSGQSLIGNGLVDGRVAADVGSLIRATGSLTLGDALSPAGFVSAGDLEVNANTVTLRDADQAVLGSLTTLGSGSEPGTLVADAGLILQFGGTLSGFGTVETPDNLESAFLNNGALRGETTEAPITLSGFVKGIGTLENVTIDGTFSPGLSPAITRHGIVNFGAAARLLAEIGGTNAGTGYDQIRFDPRAILNGVLQIDLIDAFQPAIGDVFDILIGTDGLEGDFSAIDLPELGEGLSWVINRIADRLSLGVELDAQTFAGSVTIDLVDGELVVRSPDGNNIPARGDSLSIRVTPQNSLNTQESWIVQTTEVVDGERVMVASNGTITLRVTGGGWTNYIAPSDVDGSGVTSAFDALQILSELNLASFSDRDSSTLVDPNTAESFPNLFYDASGDGRITAFDALLVINQLFLQDLEAASGEQVPLPLPILTSSETLGVPNVNTDAGISLPTANVESAKVQDFALTSWSQNGDTVDVDLDWIDAMPQDTQPDSDQGVRLLSAR